MKNTLLSNDLGNRAMEALKDVLHQVSTIELKSVEAKRTPDLSRQTEFEVQIGVLGQSHTLACKVTASCEMRAVRKALREFAEEAENSSHKTIPVFIAPSLSQEARELCVASKIGYLDFEDNARLVLGDVFVSKRSLCKLDKRVAKIPLAADLTPVRNMLPVRMATPFADGRLPAVSAA
jgi:hypothetical protein